MADFWCRSPFPLFLLCFFAASSSAQLVGPGGVAPYGSGGRRHGGYARVSQPGKGFFVGGSSLDGVNGVFERVERLPTELIELHNFSLAYRNRVSDWLMALVDAPPADELGSRPYQPYGGLRNEWVFIDERSFDRLGHAILEKFFCCYLFNGNCRLSGKLYTINFGFLEKF